MLIEKHISWLALNNVVGCPNNCVYCFLEQRKNTIPVKKEDPLRSIKKLVKNRYYTQNIPVAVMVNTDIFATRQNMNDCLNILYAAQSFGLTNLFVLVTKRKIPDAFAIKLRSLIDAGLKVLVYISYSGLPAEFEIGTYHNKIPDAIISMKTLNRYAIPCAHYWRPLLPQNTTTQKLMEVYSVVKKYCIGSVITGLKLYPHMKTPYWPEAEEAYKKYPNSECIFPKGALNRLHSIIKDYPVFVDNFCLLAFSQKEPCKYNIFGSKRCQKYNNCPYKKLKQNPCATVEKNYKKTCCKNYWGNSLISTKWIEI